jgi:hypothetical protein
MQTFIDAHPIIFTILALPVVVTLCVLVLAMCGVEYNFQRK